MTAFWGYAVWAALAAATLAVWMWSHARSSPVRPSAALARLALDPWLRVPLLLGWAWLGWHLFAR